MLAERDVDPHRTRKGIAMTKAESWLAVIRPS
jgi:hypothetical protein